MVALVMVVAVVVIMTAYICSRNGSAWFPRASPAQHPEPQILK